MSKDELGVAIVGSGDIARVHLPNIAKCPSMRLVATMDLVEEEARSLAEAGGAEYFTTDLDRVLADQEVDAVVICSALDTHVAISLEALSAGKHVFSEKPLAMTLEEARRLQRAVVETGMHLMSGWWFKHSPITSRVRQVIKEPNLVLTTLLIPDVYDLPPDDTRSPYSRGGILENGGYNLHWTWHVVRSQPVEVSATGFGGRPVNTTAINIQFENGAVGCSVFSNRGVGGTMPKWFAQVLGDEESAAGRLRVHRPGVQGRHTFQYPWQCLSKWLQRTDGYVRYTVPQRRAQRDGRVGGVHADPAVREGDPIDGVAPAPADQLRGGFLSAGWRPAAEHRQLWRPDMIERTHRLWRHSMTNTSPTREQVASLFLCHYAVVGL